MNKYSHTRILSGLLAALLFAGEITSAAYGATIPETAAADTVSVPAENNADIASMSEEELENMVKEAALNVDSLLKEEETGTEAAGAETAGTEERVSEADAAEASDASGETETSGNAYEVVSEDGTTRMELEENADGSRNILFDSDEELVQKDASEVEAVDGYEYVGTGSESGVSIYRQSIKYEDLEAYQEANALESATLQTETDRIIDWMNTPAFTEEELNAALILADRHAEETRNRYFGDPEGEKTVIKRKKTAEEDTEEVDGVIFEKVAGESLTPEEAEAMTASPSDAQKKAEESGASLTGAKETAEGAGENGSGEPQEEEVTEEAADAEDSAEPEDEYETIVLAPGETLEEEEGYTYEYLESETTDTPVLVTEPDPVITDAVVFQEGEIEESTGDGEISEEDGAALTGAGDACFDGHNVVSAEVLILRKDCVYFQINDENGKGLNGAAITLIYRKDSSSKGLTTRNLVTARVNGHDGAVYADDMDGYHDCFIDISISGYRTQTRFCMTLKGGVNYTFQMVPAAKGDIYLRAAAIDDVDICFETNEVTLTSKATEDYSITYLVAVAGETASKKVPSNVILRVKPKLPDEGTYKSSEEAKYRDRYFKPVESAYTPAGGDSRTATKKFEISAQWHLNYDPADVPPKRPESGYDDPKKVRLKADDTLYLDLPEGLSWAGTESSTTALKLTVLNAVTDTKWWENLTFNLGGVNSQGTTGTGIEFNSDIPGLKNAKLNCSLFNFRVACTVSPSGHGMIGYNLNGPLWEFYNSMKDQNEALGRPKIEYKAKTFQQHCKDNMQSCIQKCNPVAETVLNSDSDSKVTGIGTISSDMYAMFAGVFDYNRQTGYFELDVTAKVIVYGRGEITGYIMLGPVPAFAGVRGILTGTIGGTAGMKFRTGFSDLAMSNAMSFSLGLQFALTGYAGVGLHGVMCAEVEGGGNIGFVYTPAAASPSTLPFVATGGWNFGYRVTVLFMSFNASIFAKQYQIYPKEKKLTGLQGAEEDETEEDEAEEDLTGSAISLASEDCCLIVPGDPEGIAVPQTSLGANGERQYMATLEPVDTSSEEYEAQLTGTDEGSTSETKLLKKDIANSRNLQYVATGDDSGVLLRIAYIEETDDGVTRTLPRVVASRIDRDGIVKGKEYVLPTSADDSPYIKEPGILGYDYAFSATSEEVDGKRYVYVGINSGRIDIADAEKLKGKSSEDILAMAAEDDHLRVVGFNADTGEIVLNDFVCKNQISAYGEYIERDYMYTGTPAVVGHKVEDTFCYWITSTVSSLYRVNNGIPDGFTYASWNKDGEDYGTVVDGICRTNIQLTKPSDYQTGLRKYNRNKLVSTVANEAVETQKIEEDGTISYVQPESGERTAKETKKVRVEEVWFTVMFGEFQTYLCGEYEYGDVVGNLSHINNDPLADICYTTGNTLYRVPNIWPVPAKVELSREDGGAVQLPTGSDVLSYHEVTHEDESVLKLLSCYALQDQSAEEERTDSYISIMTFRNGKMEGESTSKVDRRSIVLFTAGLMKTTDKDYEPGLRLYYLADSKEQEITRTHEEIGIRGVSDLCNVYVWNWKATYGAVLKSLTAVETEVAEENKVVRFKAVIKNTGPQKLTSVTLSYTTDLEDSAKTREMEISFGYGLWPGREKEVELQIPIESDWNGWTRIYGAVTKVDGHTSVDAGFIPVWVNTGDLTGRLDLTANPRGDGYLVDLGISKWEKTVSTPEHLQLKAYFKHWTGGSEFAWDTVPTCVYSLEGAAEAISGGYYSFNFTANLGNPQYWFRGFYTEGGEQLTDRTQTIDDVDFTKAVSAVRFELCGYGDDTWNVVYDTAEVTNPMMSKLCWVSVSPEDYRRGETGGGGYTLMDDRTVKLTATPYEGSMVSRWEIKDGGEWKLFTDYTEEDLTEINVRLSAASDVRLYEFRAVFAPAPDHFWLDVGITKDETGADRAQVTVKSNGEEVTGRGYGGGLMYCYGLSCINENSVNVTYDDRLQRYKGIYKAKISLNSDGTRSVTYIDAATVATSSDYHAVKPLTESQYYSPNPDSDRTLQLMAVLEEQTGKQITFDPCGGKHKYESKEYLMTDETGHLSAEQMEKQDVYRYGYDFAGWWTEAEGGEQITKDNVAGHAFTEATTLYAHYTVKPGSLMTVRLANEYYGKVIVTQPLTEELPEAVTVYSEKYYTYEVYSVYVKPAEGYEFICQGDDACDVKFYRKKDGVWEEYDPGINRSKDHIWFLYKEDVGEVLIVPQVRKKTDSDGNLLRVEGDLLEDSRPAGAYTLTADPEKYSLLGDGAWQVKKGLSVKLTAAPLSEEVSFGDWYTYTLDAMGNRIYDPNPVSTDTEYSFTVDGDTFLYARWLKKQNLKFEQDTVNVTYGITQPVLNPLSGAKTTVSYQLTGGGSGSEKIAEIDAATGAVTVLGAGTVTVSADAEKSESYGRAHAEYKLVIGRKSLTDPTVRVLAAQNSVAVYDGRTRLSEGTDYTYTRELVRVSGETYKAVYTVTGAGNYEDTVTADTEKKIELIQFGVAVASSSVAPSKRLTAEQAAEKTEIRLPEKLDETLAQKILDDAISAGLITDKESKEAEKCIIAVVVKAELTDLEETTGRFDYTLSAIAGIQLYKGVENYYSGEDVKTVTLPVNAAWFDSTKNVEIRLGAGNSVNRMLHRHENGELIRTYKENTAVSAGTGDTGSFVYDPETKTYTAVLSCFGSSTESCTTLRTVNVHTLYVQAVREEYGTVNAEEGSKAAKVQLAEACEGGYYRVNAFPAENYTWDSQAWTVYTKNAEGLWEENTEINTPVPADSPTESSLFKMPDEDVLLVAEIRRGENAPLLLELDGSREDGELMGTAAVSGKTGEIEEYGTKKYKVKKNAEITLTETHDGSRFFIGWYGFYRDVNGKAVIDTEKISAESTAKLNLTQEGGVYAKWGTWTVQSLSFKEAAPTVMYGTKVYVNELTGAETDVEWTVSDQQPLSGDTVAEINPVTGVLTVKNAGTVKVTATAAEEAPWRAASKSYVLNVTPKPLTAEQGISMRADASTCVVLDGFKVLKADTDYTLKSYHPEGTTLTGYRAYGIGNYSGSMDTVAEEEQTKWIKSAVIPEVGENIPDSLREKAKELAAKAQIEMDSSKVPAEKLKEAVMGYGDNKIPPDALEYASDILIYTVVYADLEAYDPDANSYVYSLDPYGVIALRYGGKDYVAYAPLEEEWFSEKREIRVTLGVNARPTKIVHTGDDGTVIGTYTRGSSATSSNGQFVYNETEGTVTACTEHFSSLTITTEAEPEPGPEPEPEPEPHYYSDSSGGSAAVIWKWWQDRDGKWYLSRNGYQFKNEWAYAYNPYAQNALNQNGYEWFSFDENGVMRTGWFTDKDGAVYYLWTVSDNTLGRMLYGWQFIDGSWYYFETKSNGHRGALYKGGYTPDGYRVLSDGRWDGKLLLKQDTGLEKK